MNKKLISVLLIAALLLCAHGITAAAEEGICWYVKRNGGKRPIFSKDQQIVENYGGYYLDKAVNDNSTDKVLYLTFDAGYENGNVELIMNTLKEKSVPGAFFLLDNIIMKNTDLVKRMNAEGHTVCNHTKNHKSIAGMSLEQIKKNLLDLEKIYEQKTGLKMSKYFRPPEGRYSEQSLAIINELGYKTIFWSLAYEDWDNDKQPDEQYAIKKLLSNTHNGAVILLHPTSATNAKILPILIDKWKEMGYRFGTLDELVAK